MIICIILYSWIVCVIKIQLYLRSFLSEYGWVWIVNYFVCSKLLSREEEKMGTAGLTNEFQRLIMASLVHQKKLLFSCLISINHQCSCQLLQGCWCLENTLSALFLKCNFVGLLCSWPAHFRHGIGCGVHVGTLHGYALCRLVLLVTFMACRQFNYRKFLCTFYALLITSFMSPPHAFFDMWSFFQSTSSSSWIFISILAKRET